MIHRTFIEIKDDLKALDYAHQLLTILRAKQTIKDPEFLKFAKEQFPEYDLHHSIGSMGPLKLNDLLIIPLDREAHGIADKNRARFLIEGMPITLELLFNYINELHQRINDLVSELDTKVDVQKENKDG